MGLSLPVRAAVALVGVGALFGLCLLGGAVWLLTIDSSFLFAIIPLLFGVAVTAGIVLTGSSLQLAHRLRRREPGARLSTLLLGGCVAVSGLAALALAAVAGLLLLAYGGALVALMLTDGARTDLGAATPAPRPVRRQRVAQRPWW